MLCALNAAGVDHQDPMIRKAVDWLVSIQNKDGGWGEDAVSYRLDYRGFEAAPVDRLANGMGLAWTDGGGGGRKPGGRTGRGVPKSTQTEKGLWDEAALHGNGLSAGVLFALSWLLEVLSALGAGAVSEFEKHQQQGGRGRDVTLGAGAAATVARIEFSSIDVNPIDPRPVLIVTGLVQEARIAAGPGMIVICSSSDPQQLRALLATLDPSTFQRRHQLWRRRRARSVAEVGRRGGCDRGVWPATRGFWPRLALNEETDRQRRAEAPAAIVRGGLAGVEQVVAATACKAALRSETGAAAVDMESHIAAAYAAKAGVPLRGAAGDQRSRPAGRCRHWPRPPVKPNGDIDLRKVLRGVARNPRTLRALVSTGIDFNRALRSLRGCRGFLHGDRGPRPGEHLMRLPAAADERPDRQQRSGLILSRGLS